MEKTLGSKEGSPKKVKISLKDLIKDVILMFEENIFTFQLIAAFVIGILTLLVVIRFFRGSSKRRAVVLLGVSDSGKTKIFSKLCHNQDVLSVTSIKESSGVCDLKEKQAFLYDIPGHERIRYNIFEKLKSQAKAILFIVDSSSFQKDVRDVAEFLYNILCDGSVQKGIRNVMIACNKQDLPTAKGAQVIKNGLEKEMNLLRVTKSNQLQSVGGSDNNNSFLGRTDEDFQFQQLYPMNIFFVEVSANENQLEEIKSWLTKVG